MKSRLKTGVVRYDSRTFGNWGETASLGELSSVEIE